MKPRKYKLKTGQVLLVREAKGTDARAVVHYINRVCGESDFLTFGPGEFGLSEPEEEDFLDRCQMSDNQVYMLAVIDREIVATLNFSAGYRPRIRHKGEFGMSVRREYWGLGIGSVLIDLLIEWAGETAIITKINLRVRTDNHRAIKLYERKGFVNEGTITREMWLKDRYFDHHWMGLSL